MDAAPDPTARLLERWHQGDQQALAELVERELPWIREFVRKRLGPVLRRRGDTEDFVQEAMVDALRYGPKFVVSEERQLRGLLARIVENTLRDEHERWTAKKRDARREAAIPSQSVLPLDGAARSVTRPSEAASRDETRAWLRLALELLEPDDRQVILLRGYQELPFEAVAEHLGLSVKAAQMRFARALPRLAKKIEALQRGHLDKLLGEPTG